MARKPTIEEIQEHFDLANPFGMRGADTQLINERNHLMYRLEKDSEVYVLRMVNPESYRRKEWISMAEEYTLLKALVKTGLGPKVYWLDETFSPPFLIQEFIEGRCFNDLKPLSKKHLKAAAQAIATLNSKGITPENFPFLNKYTEEFYRGRRLVLYFRLLESLLRTRRRDVLSWTFRISPIVNQAMRMLYNFEPSLPKKKTFHLDGAHCGNVYWRDSKVIFLDWDKISYRNDDTFMLVRFATSLGEKGEIQKEVFEYLIEEYLKVRPIPNFLRAAYFRLLERQISDLVWVVWDYARRGDKRPVEEATSVAPRYEEVKKLINGGRF